MSFVGRTMISKRLPVFLLTMRSVSTDVEKTAAKRLPTVTIYSKQTGCSLCVVAKKTLARYANRLDLVEVDITLPENKPWFEKYRYEIPVLHFNGEYLMKHRVDTKLLESVLTKWEQEHSQSSLS